MHSPIIKRQKPGPKKGAKYTITIESNKAEFKKIFLEEYAKEGGTQQKAADVINMRRQNVYDWAEYDPEFAHAFEEIKFIKREKTKEEFKEAHKYDDVYKKKFLELYADETQTHTSALENTSSNVSRADINYWIRTDFEFKKEYLRLQELLRPGRYQRTEINALIGKTKLAQKQERFLEVFRECNFNVTNTCTAMEIKKTVVRDWCKKNPDFKSALDDMQDEKVDFLEDALMEQVKRGNIAAIIFGLKCQAQEAALGRRVGYVEQPKDRTVIMEHNVHFDQEQIDALVRGHGVDRGKYEKLLVLDDPTVIDAECIDKNDK